MSALNITPHIEDAIAGFVSDKWVRAVILKEPGGELSYVAFHFPENTSEEALRKIAAAFNDAIEEARQASAGAFA
jgi:hypothetical protein